MIDAVTGNYVFDKSICFLGNVSPGIRNPTHAIKVKSVLAITRQQQLLSVPFLTKDKSENTERLNY